LRFFTSENIFSFFPKNFFKGDGVMKTTVFKWLAAALVMVVGTGCVGVHINKGVKALNQSDYNRAIDEFTEEIKLGGPNKSIAYYMRGFVYAEKGDYHAAVADYSEAIRIDNKLTKQPNIYVQRGIAYARKGEYEPAIGDFNMAINVSPTYAPAYYERGIAYLDKKDYDKAIADFEAVLRINPNNKDAKEKLEKAKMGVDGLAPTAAPAAKPDVVDDELDIVIRYASNYLNDNIPKGSKIVILNIESKSAILSDYVINELIANAVNDKKFYVVDRRQLEAIQSEQKFQMSGAVDDKDALAIGKFFGAQIIVSGSVLDIGSRYRLTVQALSVQTAQVQGQYNRNIAVSKILTDLINSKR
jgi:outer membrane protein assembly factor BamD (BamD/ComL family)/TolB-like protein